MPDKLKDCSSGNLARASCSSSKVTRRWFSGHARDPRVQAILPIRGKILNVERARWTRCSRTRSPVVDHCDRRRCRRGVRLHQGSLPQDHHPRRRDVDGSHIRTLLLTSSSARCADDRSGYIYIAQPPLFSTRSARRRSTSRRVAKAVPGGASEHKKEFQRLKVSARWTGRS